MKMMVGVLAAILTHERIYILGYSSELGWAVVSFWSRIAISSWTSYKVFYTVKDIYTLIHVNELIIHIPGKCLGIK